MLELFIDRGNTALKWQLYKEGELVSSGGSVNSSSLDEALQEVAELSLSKIYVASVGGEGVEKTLKQWARRYSQCEPIFIKSCRRICGVNNAYEEPALLGVDRWLAMIAAHHLYSGLLCIVDSGTALTMDFISETGQHLGGFIVPGAELMRRSLLQNTQEIYLNAAVKNNSLGMNTSEAVHLGTEQMLRAFVCRALDDVVREHGQSVELVLTGGHAASLAGGLGRPYHDEQDLVFQGLRLVAGAME